jgi:ubiquinone/menaquinone biosynthesis C-methylase UbiE
VAVYKDSVAKLFGKVIYDTWSRQPLVLHKYEGTLIINYCKDKSVCILNVGCGAGRETIALHEMGYCNTIGIDCTKELLDVARQQAKDKNLSIDFRLANAAELPFPDGSYDLITLFANIYGHVIPRMDRVNTLKEIKRCLKSGGLILLEGTSLYNRLPHYAAIRLLEMGRAFYNPHRLERGDKLVRDAKKVIDVTREHLPRSHWFRPYEIDQEAKEAGLEVVLASTVEGVLKDPRRESRRLHKAGRLVYVLKKPDA